MMKNGQTYSKSCGVFTPQDFKSMFDHFSSLCIKGLKISGTHILTWFKMILGYVIIDRHKNWNHDLLRPCWNVLLLKFGILEL